MFGFRGGESAETVARKKAYMKDAQQRWGCLTNFDLSTIKNEVQLRSIGETATASPKPRRRTPLREWVRGRNLTAPTCSVLCPDGEQERRPEAAGKAKSESARASR